MAQPIHCDGDHDEPVMADVIITRLDGSESVAYCDPDFVQLCAGVMASVTAAQEAEERAERDATDAEALQRLGVPSEAATAVHGADAADPGGGVPLAASDDGFPGTSKVVRRGTSRSRREYEERQRQRSGPDDDEDTDEPDEAAEPVAVGVTPDPDR